MKVKKRILIALAGVMILGMSGTKSVPMMASETGDPDFMISIPAELTIQKSGWDEVGEIIMRMPPSKYIKIKTDSKISIRIDIGPTDDNGSVSLSGLT